MPTDFRIAPTPALEEFGGPAEDSPEGSFIDLNQSALAGKWVYDGKYFIARYEDESPQHDDSALKKVLTSLKEHHGRTMNLDQLKSAHQASYGTVVFQMRGPVTMHVEYLIEHHQGEPVGEATWPRQDAKIEGVLLQ